MADTVETLVGRVQQRVGLLPGYDLILDALNQALEDDLAPRREWTWRRKEAVFAFDAAYSTGTISITRGASYGDCSGASLTQAMVGRQLRVGGNNTPILTITRISGNRIEFTPAWYDSTVTAGSFEIYTAFVTVPSDFDAFRTIVDLQRSFQLDHWSLTQEDLNRMDPLRSHSGDQAFAMVLRDYTASAAGVVGDVVRASGSGNLPVSGGEYRGLSDSTIVIEMTSTTQFRWKKDNGDWTSGVTIDADGIAQELIEGVTVSFPSSVAYTSGNVFAIHLRAAVAPGLPRYEPWPHIKAEEVRPYLYLAKPPALTDPGAVIPRYVKTGYLLEKALAAIARWKNPENKYFDLKLAMIHDARAEQYFLDMEREDQGREATDVRYNSWSAFPVMDSGYLAGHDVGYEIDTLD